MKNIILGFLTILVILGMLYYFTKVKEGFTDNLGAGPPPGSIPFLPTDFPAFNPDNPRDSKDAMRPEGMITWPLGITGPYLAEYAKKYRQDFIDPVVDALGKLTSEQKYPNEAAFKASPWYNYLKEVLTTLEDWGIDYLTDGISDQTKKDERIKLLQDQGIRKGLKSDIVVGTFISKTMPYPGAGGTNLIFADLPVTALNPLAWESATSGASSQPSTLEDSYAKAMASPDGYSRPNGSKEPGTLVEINKNLLNRQTPNFSTIFPETGNNVGSMVNDWATKTKSEINPSAPPSMTFSISYHDNSPESELGPVLKTLLDKVKTKNKIITIGDKGSASDGTFLFKECQIYSGSGREFFYNKAKKDALALLGKYDNVPEDFKNALVDLIVDGKWDTNAQNADVEEKSNRSIKLLKRDILTALNPTMREDVRNYLADRTWIASLRPSGRFEQGFSPYSSLVYSGVDGKKTFMTARQGGALGTGLYNGNLYINVMNNGATSLDPKNPDSVKELTFFGVTIGDGAKSTMSGTYSLKDISFARRQVGYTALPIVSMITDSPSGIERPQFLNAAKGIAPPGGKDKDLAPSGSAGDEFVIVVDVRQGPADATGDPRPPIPPRPDPRPGPGIITRGGPFEGCFAAWTQNCALACEGKEQQCAEDLANDPETVDKIGDKMAGELKGINGGNLISEFKTDGDLTILKSNNPVSQISESWYGDKSSFARNPPCVFSWNPADCDPENVGGTFNIGRDGSGGRKDGTGGAWRTFAAYMPGGEAGSAAMKLPSYINAASMSIRSRANTSDGGGDPLIYVKDPRTGDINMYKWDDGTREWEEEPVAGYMNTGNDLIFYGPPASKNQSKKELRREERRLRKLRRKERKSRRRRERRLSSKRNFI